VKYAFVEKNRRQYGVPALCEALQVSRSGYYAARHRGPSDRQKRQVDLTARIRTIHQASRESYGAPRVHVELLAQEMPCCRNTVAKLMHKAGILPKAIRRFRVTTDSRKTQASPNLIHRDFTSEHPNDLWLSDITYIPTREGWLYLLEGLGGLGDEPNSGHQAGDRCVDHGDRASGSTGNAALRPGVNVRHRKLPGNRQPLRHQAEHESQR